MAMSAGGLQSRILSKLQASLEGKFTGIADDQNLGGYSFTDNMILFAQAVAEGVYEEITQNARCQGLDSGSDSHDAVKIV